MISKPLAALALVAALAANPVLAQETASGGSGESEVVARVNGDEIYQADLIAFIQRLPQQLQAQVQMLMPQILDQLVNNRLTTQAGRAAGLAKDEEVMEQVAKIEDLIVGQIFLQRAIDERVTDDKMEAAYQDFLTENPPQRELRARHILVETEDEAKAVIVELVEQQSAAAGFFKLADAAPTSRRWPRSARPAPAARTAASCRLSRPARWCRSSPTRPSPWRSAAIPPSR